VIPGRPAAARLLEQSNRASERHGIDIRNGRDVGVVAPQDQFQQMGPPTAHPHDPQAHALIPAPGQHRRRQGGRRHGGAGRLHEVPSVHGCHVASTFPAYGSRG
jgi:hypothetical protein